MVSLHDGLPGGLDRKTHLGWDIFSSLLSHPKHPRTLGLTASIEGGNREGTSRHASDTYQSDSNTVSNKARLTPAAAKREQRNADEEDALAGETKRPQ